MTIAVNQPEKINAIEGQTLEFKTSAFYAPGENNPSFKQMRTIAETVAAFMNAEGGALIIGVADDGTVKGIDGDLDVLRIMPSSVVLRLPQMDDSTFIYKATPDHYQLKLQHILQAFLSPNHAMHYAVHFVKSPQTKTLCCKIDVKKCADDDFVYCTEKYSPNKLPVDEIFVRIGNEKKPLHGRERDEFVKGRVKAELNRQLDTLRTMVSLSGSDGNSALAVSVRELLSRLDGAKLEGSEITVTGGQPFIKEVVMSAKKPKSLAWEGMHYAEVSGWQELVLKVLEKLQEVNAAKFDELVDIKPFSKYLIRVLKPRERHGECYPGGFGSEHKIRIKKSLGNKLFLWQEEKALRQMIVAFGVDVRKFMFVAG